MHTPSLVSLLTFAGLALQAVAVTVANAGGKDTVPNRYIVTLKAFANETELEDHTTRISSYHARRARRDLNRRAGTAGITQKFKFDTNGLTGYAIECDGSTLEQILSSPDVASVEQEGRTKVAITQTSSTWGLDRISDKVASRPQPWKYSYQATWAGNGVTVYVVDTGIRISHTDFEGRASNGVNIAGGYWADQYGHGTHVAGTIAGKRFGVAKKAKVVSVKVLDKDGAGFDSWTIKGLEWISKHAKPGRSVVNMSLEGGRSSALNNAVQALYQKGIVVVVAAGNSDENAYNVSPASAPNAITVGAIDWTNYRAYFSNWGSNIDIFAPGVDVNSLSEKSDTGSKTLQGTSMACPHVAGLAAYFISSSSKAANPYAIFKRIIDTSVKNQVKDTKNSVNRIAYNGF